MFGDNVVDGSASANQLTPLSFTLSCGIASLEKLIINSLKESGFAHSCTSHTLILVDAPQGFALRQLELLSQKYTNIIVTTNNRCPEYYEDLWDLQPTVLLVGDTIHGELEGAIQRVANGERYRITPGQTSCLSKVERAMLRCVSRGWTTERIAAYRGVSTKTVYNTLANVCVKLGMPTRRAAMLYYWGRADLID